jgi:hypothetical protein
LVEVVDQFNDQFTFTDHALGLEFKDKRRLTEFFAKMRERFPDSERMDNTLFSGGDRVVSEWTLTATQTEPFLGGRQSHADSLVVGLLPSPFFLATMSNMPTTLNQCQHLLLFAFGT